VSAHFQQLAQPHTAKPSGIGTFSGNPKTPQSPAFCGSSRAATHLEVLASRQASADQFQEPCIGSTAKSEAFALDRCSTPPGGVVLPQKGEARHTRSPPSCGRSLQSADDMHPASPEPSLHKQANIMQQNLCCPSIAHRPCSQPSMQSHEVTMLSPDTMAASTLEMQRRSTRGLSFAQVAEGSSSISTTRSLLQGRESVRHSGHAMKSFATRCQQPGDMMFGARESGFFVKQLTSKSSMMPQLGGAADETGRNSPQGCVLLTFLYLCTKCHMKFHLLLI
jgi:hypothetical protein